MIIKPKDNKTPSAGDFGEYEQVKVDEFIHGVIADIEYDPAHEVTYQGEKKVFEAVKIKFTLDGYTMPHSSFYLKLSYHEKSTLYKTVVKNLVENAEPFLDLDLSLLKGMRVKTMWENVEGKESTYQKLVMVKPEGEKISSLAK
jgi:hypothetical protein